MERVLVMAGVFVAMLAPAAALVSMPAPDRGPFLVTLPPWADAEAIVTAAGGRIIGPLEAPFAVLATADADGFARLARARGAWFVTDGAALARLCGV